MNTGKKFRFFGLRTTEKYFFKNQKVKKTAANIYNNSKYHLCDIHIVCGASIVTDMSILSISDKFLKSRMWREGKIEILNSGAPNKKNGSGIVFSYPRGAYSRIYTTYFFSKIIRCAGILLLSHKYTRHGTTSPSRLQ